MFVWNRENIQVVIMDMMPLMVGAASIRAPRRINPQAKIIAVSGLLEERTERIDENSVHAFLLKPYTTEKLLRAVREALNTRPNQK